jgi:hypothetical protein
MLVNGVEYLDEDAELFPDGTVHDATLAHDTDIQGLPWAGRRSVVFYPSGRIRLAWLRKPTPVGSVPCAAGITYLHENGSPLNVALASPHEFDGIAVEPGSRVTFDDDGRLLEFSVLLDHDQEIGGLPCSAQFSVWLYPDGRPSLVVLASSASVGGQEYQRGSELFLSDAGEVLTVQSIDLDAGHRFKRRVFGVYETAWE